MIVFHLPGLDRIMRTGFTPLSTEGLQVLTDLSLTIGSHRYGQGYQQSGAFSSGSQCPARQGWHKHFTRPPPDVMPMPVNPESVRNCWR